MTFDFFSWSKFDWKPGIVISSGSEQFFDACEIAVSDFGIMNRWPSVIIGWRLHTCPVILKRYAPANWAEFE
jgi:hypothetical protein